MADVERFDVVVVGAGPVGLWTAIQVKKRNPVARVVILERYESYRRSHVLRLDHLSMLLYCRRSADARELEFYQEAIGKDSKPQSIKSVYLRTNTLEAALRRYALDLGVAVIHREALSPSEVQAHFPGACCYIAADGAHSRMRRSLLGENELRSTPLQYVVEAKYEARGASRPLDFMREGYKTQKILKFLTFEYVGRARDGVTPVTLRLFVDRKTYDEVPTATFKAPLPLNFEQLPQLLTADLNTYLNVRKSITGEEYIPGSGKLTKLILSTYRAKKFAVVNDGVPWFLVGDAAMGVPYFRALNCGMLCSSLLAMISCGLIGKDRSPSRALALYTWFATMRFLTERFIAAAKNTALGAVDVYRRWGAMVPWQTTKWSGDDVFAYKTQEHYALDDDGAV